MLVFPLNLWLDFVIIHPPFKKIQNLEELEIWNLKLVEGWDICMMI